jgi:predicted flap endonuclease-1-like 5' DNA nuclease
MRSDYALYVVAIIFFILTGTIVALSVELKELWTVATAVLGLFFVALGYTQRPRPTAITMQTPSATIQPPAIPASAQPATIEVIEQPKMETTVEVAPTEPSEPELMKVKGIGPKRVDQLKELGISTVEELSTASANDLAKKLQISPKITGKWIAHAKEIAGKS